MSSPVIAWLSEQLPSKWSNSGSSDPTSDIPRKLNNLLGMNKKYNREKERDKRQDFPLLPLCERQEVLTNGSFVIGGERTPWKPSFTSPEERVLTRDVGGAKWASWRERKVIVPLR
ncbi:hypothetical protein CEXT_291951 [Caerostris extrusa]|uniref:Uncharacterized protein n=1 Tax=Caerostris extrusa TaxID=172846 RepID=A0AAV4WYS2_CAEEX|nr:hypothetical protein CEXT_291951 [Caerostris extrusa]